MNRPVWISKWFNDLIKEANFSVKDVSLSSSKDWRLVDGAIWHKSEKFFQIVGVEWADSNGKKQVQPLIEQREIGTLGFLTRSGNGEPEILVQAKIEPGNVGIVQLAPTCQATDSNAKQIHGGEKPPYLDWFNTSRSSTLYDVLQSEQGTRFLGKRNRNVLRLAKTAVPETPSHRWLKLEQVLKLLPVDFLINTDARSVLVCSPWETLVTQLPFTKSNSPFAKELAKSYKSESRFCDLQELKSDLKNARATAKNPSSIALEELKGWKFYKDNSTILVGKEFSIRLVHVSAHGREVPEWEQPLVDSSSNGRIELLCGRIDSVLHFLFRPYYEPGLYNHIELGPSVMIEPGAQDRKNYTSRGIVRIESKQSEEGGRFYRDINHYKIIDIGEVPLPIKTTADYWLTLAQIRGLLNEEGWFTNEARSVLSFLLTWV